jgi:hypothetical protein
MQYAQIVDIRAILLMIDKYIKGRYNQFKSDDVVGKCKYVQAWREI